MHRPAEVGHRPLTKPRHEVEAAGGGERQNADDHQEIAEVAADVLAPAGGRKAPVDDQLEPRRDGERGGRRDRQCNEGGGDLCGVSGGEAPDDTEASDRRLAVGGAKA